MDKIIHQSVVLKCDVKEAFEMFTINKNLEHWLTKETDVEPRIGGKFELFWNPEDKEIDSTIGCKILAFHPDKLICFEWKGPRQFSHFMNEVRPLTNVIVSFTPTTEGTEVQLLHIGWRDTPEWDEAREWFEKAWANAFTDLQKYLGQISK